jgi:hypothetical protein
MRFLGRGVIRNKCLHCSTGGPWVSNLNTLPLHNDWSRGGTIQRQLSGKGNGCQRNLDVCGLCSEQINSEGTHMANAGSVAGSSLPLRHVAESEAAQSSLETMLLVQARLPHFGNLGCGYRQLNGI